MIRSFIKFLYLRLWILPRTHRAYSALSVAETMQNIYRSKAWGDNGQPYCSGTGSTGPVIEQYCAFVIKFINDHKVRSVVDLGCGDFAIGKRIVEATRVRYTGIDVVPELIEYHNGTTRHPRVTFLCADIANTPLPQADLCLVRQVFQHLSNEEVANILANLGDFYLTLVSEDVPVKPRIFNRDKPHGPDVRTYYGSGVYVEQPPFSRPAAEVWEITLTNTSLLRTVLLDQSGSRESQVKRVGASRLSSRHERSTVEGQVV